MALIDKLSAIGDAIREKNGTTDLIPLGDMPAAIQAIQTGGDIPEEAFVFTGDCSTLFANNKWAWFLAQYGNQITTNDITNALNMFNRYQDDAVESIPFDFNFKQGTQVNTQQMFSNATGIKYIGNMINLCFGCSTSMFGQCYNLRSLPNFVNADFSQLHTATTSSKGGLANIFRDCYSLRSIPEDLVKELYNKTSASYTFVNGGISFCYTLDEIRGITLGELTYTSNCFNTTNCYRLKNYIFATQEDGAPYVKSLKNQMIDLTTYIGYAQYDWAAVQYNSGITVDKRVKDDATYQALKDDADWFSTNIAYSRYNHDSAVATINSLPDTSAYLAAQTSGTNTIKFKGASGSATDGGAINTLTEEEIAVATAKGWTVTLS